MKKQALKPGDTRNAIAKKKYGDMLNYGEIVKGINLSDSDSVLAGKASGFFTMRNEIPEEKEQTSKHKHELKSNAALSSGDLFNREMLMKLIPDASERDIYLLTEALNTGMHKYKMHTHPSTGISNPGGRLKEEIDPRKLSKTTEEKIFINMVTKIYASLAENLPSGFCKLIQDIMECNPQDFNPEYPFCSEN